MRHGSKAPLVRVKSQGAGGSVLVAFAERKLSNYSVAPGSLDACVLFLWRSSVNWLSHVVLNEQL